MRWQPRSCVRCNSPRFRPCVHGWFPEFRVYASAIEGCEETLTAGIADAVAINEEGRIDVVVDWKSDVNPGAGQIAMYQNQVREYLRSTAAQTGLIVFLGSGRIDKVVVDD